MTVASMPGDDPPSSTSTRSPSRRPGARRTSVYLQAGADEPLLDDSRMFAERAGAAGVDVTADVYPGMLHSFQMMAGRTAEADEAVRQLARWCKPKLGLA